MTYLPLIGLLIPAYTLLATITIGIVWFAITRTAAAITAGDLFVLSLAGMSAWGLASVLGFV